MIHSRGLWWCWDLIVMCFVAISSELKKLPKNPVRKPHGYPMERRLRYRFQVNYVDTCPLNKASWENASVSLNCSRDASRLNRYYCVPNQQKSALIEFCYDQFSGRYEKGKCIRLFDSGFLDSKTCSTFSYGCPNASYLGDEIYDYPACLQINPIQKCYITDNLCVTPTRETTHSGTNVGQEIASSYHTSTAVVFNQTTHNATGNSNSNSNIAIPILASLGVIALVIAVLLIIRWCWHKRKKKKQDEENSDLNGQELHEQDEENSLLNGQEFSEQDEENSLLSEQELRDIHIYGKTIVVYGQQIIINSRGDNSFPAFKEGQWIKINGTSEKKININEEKYSGSSNNLRSPLLVINNANFHDNGIYKIKSDYGVSNELHVTVTGNIHIYGKTIVVYGQQIIINSRSDYSFPAFKEGQWIKINGTSEGKININEEKYSGSSNNLRSPLLVINNANFHDNGIYKIKSDYGVSNELHVTVTGSGPSVSISRFKMEGKKTIIVCESSVTQDSPKITSVQWTRNAHLIDTSQHPNKYSGGTIHDPSLTIKYLDTSDIGEYRCKVRNGVGETESESFHLNIDLRIEGRTRVIHGHKAIMNGTVTCIQERHQHPPFSQDVHIFKWIKKDGNSETINIQNVKYSGSSNEPKDLSLVINKADFMDNGIYMLTVNGLFSNELQLDVTKNDISTMPTEVQLVLFFLLLQDNFQINIKKEDLSLPFEFLDFKMQSREELRNVLRKFKEALTPYIDELDGRYQINPDIRDDLVLSFMKNEKCVDIFLDKACIDNIKKYCRTTTYKSKGGEICFNLDSQQTESFIERLQYDILTHATMDDIESHSLIANKLKIPIEILHRGKVGIQEYLEQLSKGKVCVYHAQGMIVGCAGAGKTTLLKKLKGRPLSDILDTVSTRGVDIQSDVFSVAEDELSVNSEEKALHLNIQQSEIAPERDDMISNEEKYNHQVRGDLIRKEKKELLPNIPESNTEPEEVERNRTKEEQLKTRFPENTIEVTMPNRTQEAQEINDNIYTSEEDNIQPKPQKLEQMQALSFLSDTKEKTPKTITIFDFAGQLAYYVTHQIFMRPRAFYVFVIDMTKNLDDPVEKDETMTKKTYKEIYRHWMQMIHTFNGMAPVILVATHAEGKSRENIKKFFRQIWDLIPEDIQKRHLHDQREFAVELKKPFGIVEIKRSILHTVSKADHWGEVRPTSWVMFESYLVKTKERIKVIKTEDLWTENKHLDTKFQLEKEEDMKKMLQFFHDTGAILFFDEDGLRNDIILDVPWFVDAFKHIITDPVHANEDFVRIRDTFVPTHCECKTALTDLEKSGILRVSLVHAIWKLYKDRYDTYFKHMREIMRYMERLGMLAKLTNSPEETWYVPCMNKRLFSKQEFENFSVSQTLCFQFKFLPPSIYHRLISSCLNQLGFTIPHWPKAKYFYKDAVLLHKKNFEHNFYVLIGSDEFQNRIDMQFLSREGFKVDRKYSTILKNEITDKLQGLKETFHTNLGSFTIGYQCRINIFSQESAGHFIPESDFKGTAISCPDCDPLNRIVVQDVLYQWNQNHNVTLREKVCLFVECESKCLRVEILSHLMAQGMNDKVTGRMKNKRKCSGKCDDVCKCTFCVSCAACF